MNSNLRRLVGSQIFYFAFGLRLAVSLITLSLLYEKYIVFLKPFLNICNLIVFVLLVSIILFFQSYRFKELTAICICSLIFYSAALRSGQGFLLLGWLFICASKNIDIKIMSKETFFISVFILIMLCGLTVIGLIDISIGQRMDGFMRYSIGFANPNTLGNILLQIIIAFTIKRNKWDLPYFIVLSIIFLLSYNILNCRSVSICIFLLGIFVLIFQNKHSQHLRILGFFITILASLLSIYISVRFNVKNSWMLELDTIFSWRITLANRYINEYGFSLLGAQLDLSLLGALDNAYVRAAVFYGIIPLILYVYANVQLFVQEGNYINVELICVIIMILYGIMEAQIFIINYNITLLILANTLYKRKVNWKIKKMRY